MNTDPHWTAYVTAIVMPIIALIAAWIAFRQSQIASNKLKYDLFTKRMEIYEVVRQTLGAAVRKGKLTPEEELDYLSGIRSAKWLFGPEVYIYLEETLWHKIVDFGYHNTMTQNQSEDRTKHIHARAEIFKWISAQYEEFDKLCANYLTLKH